MLGGEAVLYAGAMTGLYTLWYKDYPASAFHFFNDGAEWQQTDKVCHAAASYYVGRLGYDALRLAGADEKKSVWLGGTIGLFFLTTVEVFDGFSAEWGFSSFDMLANVAGAGLFVGQQLAWKEQRLMLKYSFRPTDYPSYRPDLLGENYLSQAVKDYNGITVWLSANMRSFFPQAGLLPRWLNIAAGYGATGMTGGFANHAFDKSGNPIPEFERYRRFFLSLDVDLSKIPVKSKFLKTAFEVIGFIKVPFPTLEIDSRGGVKGHWVYF